MKSSDFEECVGRENICKNIGEPLERAETLFSEISSKPIPIQLT